MLTPVAKRPKRRLPDSRRARCSAPDPRWHQDAIIYQLHVRTFCDSNGDGIGDFIGLVQRLDYIARLGVTAIWLLPFYESPLRDDGYDIAHYERIDPRYGTMDDFKLFLAEAHRRGLQVITELVINHTSDQHPWFQASRRAPVGTPKRDFYIWSDTDQKFLGARIIFSDVEPSNWTWDPLAGQFYFHRFFRHQPDLNYDNPRVQRAALKIMRFWLDMGVDGMRLDAVSHLFEREGTTCENLPETHAFLKVIRAEMDRRYDCRVFLAEADQLPASARPYFGDGDECHMVFDFPLMPQLFLALAIEQASPIELIVKETDYLPTACQWALFLRNHDEVALSTLTAEQRATVMAAYAPDPRMRLNGGIRRRLAPLLGNDRTRIELAFGLLFSLPGSPVLYYGDEIGMGDNIWLNDRDGVRTPMQWNGERHAGFSNTQKPLTAPVIDDETYGYRVRNVEFQESDPSSLLCFMKRLVAVRRRHCAFGRGRIEFIGTGNAHVLAFIRRDQQDAVLVVANLRTTAESCDLRLPSGTARLANLIEPTAAPIDVAEDGALHVTLGPSAFRWWQVEDRAGARSNI